MTSPVWEVETEELTENVVAKITPQSELLNQLRLTGVTGVANGDIGQWPRHQACMPCLPTRPALAGALPTVAEDACTNASFLLNGDDDVFATHRQHGRLPAEPGPDQHLFVGHLIHNVGPIRIPWSKYYVPKVVMEEEHYRPTAEAVASYCPDSRPPPCARLPRPGPLPHR